MANVVGFTRQIAGLTHQIFKFGLVGAVNTAIDTGVYVALTREVVWFAQNYLVAGFVAFLIAGINGFWWHKKWTFRHAMTYRHTQLVRFYLGAGGALVVNEAVLWLLVQQHWYDILAKLVAAVAAGVVNFCLQKFWTFGRE